MKLCKYHPAKPATWFCASCNIAFCSACVPEDKINYLPKCTLCRRSLTSESVANRVPVFWSQFRQFFSLPLNISNFIVITCFALVLSILPDGKLGLVLFVLTLIPLVEFLFETMEKVASGDSLKSSVSTLLKFESKSNFIKLLFTYLVIFLILAKLININAGLGWMISAFFVFGVPASLVILMMEKSMIAMINPLKIGVIIRLFGKAYLVLYLCMLIIFVSVISVKTNSFNETIWLKSYLIYWFAVYLSAVVCVMAGYLVYQYHFELNFTINRKSLYKLSSQQEHEPLVEVDILIQEGRFEEAQKLLLDRIAQIKSDFRAFEKLILLFAVQDKPILVTQYTDQYFEEMRKANKLKQISSFYQKLTEREIAYLPKSSDIAAIILEGLTNINSFPMGIKLANDFLIEYPMQKNWESIYLSKAKILAEFANDLSAAKNDLNFILKRSIEQHHIEAAENYLQIIKNT